MPAPCENRPSNDELRALYIDQRKTTREIGELVGVRHIAIRRWLAAAEIPLRASGRGLANQGVVAPTKGELWDMVHVQHLSYQQIADQYGLDYTAIPHWLTKHDIPKPKVWETRRKGAPAPYLSADELRRRYRRGETLAKIAASVGVSRNTVRSWCKDAGVEVAPDGFQGGRRWVCADGHSVRSVYEQRVDDWLSEHGLAHELEPRVPFNRKSRSDFLVGGVYIEVWGVAGSAKYDERKKRKIAGYRANGLPLIELPYWTFSRPTWRKRLSALIPESESLTLPLQLQIPA